jgi:hypothetical protein
MSPQPPGMLRSHGRRLQRRSRSRRRVRRCFFHGVRGRWPCYHGCYWERLSGFGGSLGEIIANNFTNVHQIVTIKPTDAGFSSSNCGTWTNQIVPWKAPTASFSGGTWLVNGEIAAGTWTNSDSSNGCYWERLSGFSGELADIIENEFTFNPTVVTISSSDTGFSTIDCGTWTYLGP